MDTSTWKELGMQILVGALYGAAAAFISQAELTQAALMAVVTGAIKGIAHAVVTSLTPKQVAAGKQFKKLHWTEKVARIL